MQLDWAIVIDAGGNPTQLACVVTDVGAQVAATAQLRQARERDEVLWQQAPIGIIESTPDGIITSANAAIGAMLGYQPENLIGMHAWQLADPSHTSAIAVSSFSWWAGAIALSGATLVRTAVRYRCPSRRQSCTTTREQCLGWPVSWSTCRKFSSNVPR